MLDFKDTAVFMWFWGVNVNENCKRKILFSEDFLYKCNVSLHVTR